MHYMIINGFNTSHFAGSHVIDFGEAKAAETRTAESVTVYGANGILKVPDGAYNGYSRKFVFVVKHLSEAMALIEKFNAFDNVVEFGYLPGSHFYCDLESSSYKPRGAHRWTVDITVMMHPFRYVKADPIILTQSSTIKNIGTVYSEPVIVVEGNGLVTLTIGEQLMELTLDTKATIDCRHKKQNIYDKSGAIKNTIRKRGPFFEIPVGTSGVSVTGNVSKVIINGNWRYKV